MSEIWLVVYCSRSKLIGSRSAVETQTRKILATARVNNKRAHLTGAMAFNESFFAQVIEGARDDLVPIFNRIRHDSRHSEVKILTSRTSERRLFPSWSMAYVALSHSDGHHPLAHFSFESALTDGAEPEAQQLLSSLQESVLTGRGPEDPRMAMASAGT